MKKVLLFIVSILYGLCTFSQESETKTDTLRKDALNVFMSASDYIRREIPYVNYVRDIKDAAVYIISTSQMTGSGGREYTYYLTGQNEFAGMDDTLSFTVSPDETTDDRRQKEVATLKMGLMRYVLRTPLADYIRISFSEPLSETVSTDRWNSWVFSSSISTYLNGQKTYQSRSISTNFRASKVTEDWKIRLYLYYTDNLSKYEIGDKTISSEYDYKYSYIHIVKSISDHWSYGGSFRVGAYSYQNQDFTLEALPGIEYDLFPYSESTRRQFRILYNAGYNFVNYQDTTIYNKTEEHLWLHKVNAAYQVVQKWGSINVNIGYSNYLHDWSKNNLDFGTSISLRIAKGLSVRLFGSYSIIHDQLGLVKGGATDEEILLQIKEIETQYSYYTSFGFTYTFGSIYNNVVNPRFGSGF